MAAALLLQLFRLPDATASQAPQPGTSHASPGHGLWLQPASGSDIAAPGVPPARLGPTLKGLTFNSVTGYVVRTAYIIPSNRSAQPNAVSNLRTALLVYQSWYRDQMQQNGFGPKTFAFETESDGAAPRVYTIQVAETDSYLREDLWNRTISAAVAAGVPLWTPKQVWWLIPEAHLERADGAIVGGTALGASFGSGDDPGVAMVGSDALARFKPSFLANDLGYSGQVVAEIGAYALQQDISFPWFEGTTFSSTSSSVLGAAIHELSHGFGLPHDFRNDRNFNGNLMGNGLRGLRGNLYPDRYPSDYTRAAYGSTLALSVSRYFNPKGSFTDNTKPSLTLTTQGAHSPVQGLVQISFNASDASGLYAAWLHWNGDLAGEMTLSGTAATRTFSTPCYTPGQINQYTISVFDTQGNKQTADTAIIPRTGFNQAPQPFVTLSAQTVLVGQNVILDAAYSTDPDGNSALMQVEWDLDGDGVFDTSPTTLKSLTYQFPAPGDRLVRARLTDAAGAQAVSTPLSVHVSLPVLGLSRTANRVQVSWSANAGGFALESASALPPLKWQSVTQGVRVVGGKNTVTLTNPPSQQLFHLKR